MSGQTTYAGHKVDVLTGEPGLFTRVLVDARSFLPVQVKQTFSGGLTTTTTFSDFTHLPPGASTEMLLNMSPHPGAVTQHP